jgi:hypothetical protein
MTHVVDVAGLDGDRVPKHGRRLSLADRRVNKVMIGSARG